MLSRFRHVCERSQTETGCSRCGASGFVEGTALRVRGGWRQMETIDRNDQLHVFPKGRMRPAEIISEQIWLDPVDCPLMVHPLDVPPQALGNREAFLLQQEMRVLMHDATFRPVLGTGYVTIRAGDLPGFRGIAYADPPQGARLVRPVFDSEQFVLAAGGCWVLCPPTLRPLQQLIEDGGAQSVIGGRTIRHLNSEEADAFLVVQERCDREQDHATAHP